MTSPAPCTIIAFIVRTILIVLLVAGIAVLFLKNSQINSFEDCVKAGNPVMESYPEQCRTKDGKGFVRDIGNELEKTDLIMVNHPRPGDTVSGNITVIGEARGYWFFEGDFPIVVVDQDGKEIGTSYASAQNEWMTEEFVPFEGTVEINSGNSKNGTLILKKANASGLPEHDDEVRMPIIFD